jgi:hypothetical protein
LPRFFAAASAFLSAVGNHASLELGHRNHLLRQKTAGCTLDLREIGEPDVDASLEQPRKEGYRARQAIDLGNN